VPYGFDLEARALIFVTDPIFGEHLRGVPHCEAPERVEVVAARLRAAGSISQELAAVDATAGQLLRVHTPAYLDLVHRQTDRLAVARYLTTGDVIVGPGTREAAYRAAGAAIAAVDAAVSGDRAVFALVRPPGHHAEPGAGMGFCVFNNAAVAARYFLAERGGRVLVLDFDYHHGNGTEAIAGDGLSYASTHAWPAYPGSGGRSGRRGTDEILNLPLPASGISTEAFVAIWERLLAVVAARVRPTLIVVSAGFDFVAGDPVGDLGVDVSASRGIAAAIRRAAAQWCDSRVVYVLEGGYLIDALSDGITAIAEASDTGFPALSGADPRAIPPDVAFLLA
jgi:acetoin utilization deacetylase AcuC-like enzyme